MQSRNFWQILGLIVCFGYHLNGLSKASPEYLIDYDPAKYSADIAAFYAKAPFAHENSLENRIKIASAYFLGQPYVLGNLGEGPTGQFDQEPLYRSDGFDCLTFVETVLALAHANSLDQFEKMHNKIRYLNGEIAYQARNHFTSVDWNYNNTSLGFLKDITYKIVDKAGKPVAKVAEAIINKPEWYQHKGVASIKLRKEVSEAELQQKLAALRGTATQVQQEKAVTEYIPLTALFDEKGRANAFIFNQIPDTSIIEIVRPNWNLAKRIGTNLNISHLGFAIQSKTKKGVKGLMYREASSVEKKVVDIPLTDYLRGYLGSETVKGIAVLETTDPSA